MPLTMFFVVREGVKTSKNDYLYRILLKNIVHELKHLSAAGFVKCNHQSQLETSDFATREIQAKHLEISGRYSGIQEWCSVS